MPWGSLLATALVLCFEIVIAPLGERLLLPHFWPHSSPVRDDVLRAAAQLRLANPQATRVVVTGSSQAREAVDRDRAMTTLANVGHPDVEVWNLALSGGDAIDAYLQLDGILESPPRVVIWLSSWVFFFDSYDPAKLPRHATSLTRLKRLAELYGTASFWRDAEDTLPAALLACISRSFRWARTYLSRELILNSGTHASSPVDWFEETHPKGEEYFTGTLAHLRGRRYGTSLATLRKQRALAAFARELEEHGVELVVAEAPLHPRAAEVQLELSLAWEDHQTAMRRLSVDLGFTYVEMHACDTDRADLFTDFGHLNELGRRRFTDCLVRRVVADLLP